MDTVTILRDLWRVRRGVVTVALLALLAGTAVVYKISFPPNLESRRYEVGVATARILVDTPSSQVVEVAPKGSDSLGVRANLLATLMVDGVVKSAIARRAGLSPQKLVGINEAAAVPAPGADPPGRRAFVLKTRVVTNTDGAQLPIIEVEAQAPDRAGAGRLGAAAVAGLRDYLDSTASEQQIADAQPAALDRSRCTDRRRRRSDGPAAAIAILIVLVVFLLGCAVLVGMLALVRSWRAASAREQLEAEASGAEAPRHSVEPEEDWFDISGDRCRSLIRGTTSSRSSTTSASARRPESSPRADVLGAGPVRLARLSGLSKARWVGGGSRVLFSRPPAHYRLAVEPRAGRCHPGRGMVARWCSASAGGVHGRRSVVAPTTPASRSSKSCRRRGSPPCTRGGAARRIGEAAGAAGAPVPRDQPRRGSLRVDLTGVLSR